MTWRRACTVLCRYYPGINPLVIPEMTVYQFAYYLDEIGWMENQSRVASSADAIMGKTRGQTPSTADIRALARQINPNSVIPKR